MNIYRISKGRWEEYIEWIVIADSIREAVMLFLSKKSYGGIMIDLDTLSDGGLFDTFDDDEYIAFKIESLGEVKKGIIE